MWNAAKQSTKNLFILWRCSWLFSTSKFNFCLTVIISWFISFLMWSWRRLSKTKFERGNLCDSGRRLFLNNKLKRKINFIKTNYCKWQFLKTNKLIIFERADNLFMKSLTEDKPSIATLFTLDSMGIF